MSGDVRMKGFAKRASVADAEALIASRVRPLGDERVPFSRALGRILAETLVSDRDVPPYPKSAMDGYAVRAADLPGRLRVVAERMAADEDARLLGPGEAVRTMTGARIVRGGELVVMAEHARLESGPDGDHVVIERADPIGTHVLQQGEDLARGRPVLAAGRRILPQDVAMLVTIGALEVPVRQKPRVRIVPTGNELVPVGAPATGAAVVESNSYMIAALAERDGAQVELHPIVRDDEAMLAKVLAAPGADLVVVMGGSSVGKQDLGPVVVRRIGELPVHGIQVRPASPTGIGWVHEGPAVLLAPGFPVASYVAWDLFGRPIVQRMLGLEPALPYATATGALAAPYTKPADRVELARVVLGPSAAADGGPSSAIEVLPGGAALLSTTTRAHGFVLFPAGRGAFAAGEAHVVHLYG